MPVEALPAVSNVRQLTARNLFSGVLASQSTHSAGPIDNVEEMARRSENYGISSAADLVRYEVEESAEKNRGANMFTSGSRFARRAAPAPMDVDGSLRDPNYFRPSARNGLVGSTINQSSLACISHTLETDLTTNGFKELWDELDSYAQSDAALSAVGKVYLGTPTKYSNWKALLQNNVVVPITILLARPMIKLHTYSLYFILAGEQTLITRFGQPLTTWANEGNRQIYTLNIAFKSKTWCINNKNIYHCPNVFIAGLSRGYGLAFFRREELARAVTTDGLGSSASIVAIPEPYEPYLSRKIEPIVALTGKFKFMDSSFQDDPERNDRMHYYNVWWANAWYGFQQLSRQERVEERHRLQMGKQNLEQRLDFICWAGQSLHYHPAKSGFNYLTPSRALLPNTHYGPGMCKAMRSADVAFPVQDFTKYDEM